MNPLIKNPFSFCKNPRTPGEAHGGLLQNEGGWGGGGLAAELGDRRWEMGKERHWSNVIGGECRMEGVLGHRIETFQCRIIQEND